VTLAQGIAIGFLIGLAIGCGGGIVRGWLRYRAYLRKLDEAEARMREEGQP
jgi:ABC-type nitrate/sulfonate/bicarbonate transport system permease component